MKTRIIWIVFSLLAFLMLTFISIGVYQKWEIHNNGDIVDVTVTAVPTGSTIRGNIKFEFRNRIYVKSLDENPGKILYVGDVLQMKHLDKYDIFLFIDENPIGWGLLAIALVLACSIFFLYYAIRKTPPPVVIFGKNFS